MSVPNLNGSETFEVSKSRTLYFSEASLVVSKSHPALQFQIDTKQNSINNPAGWPVWWLLKADHTEDEPADELQVLTVSLRQAADSQVTGGLRLCHPLSAHLCAKALCDIFGCVTHPQHSSRTGCSGLALNYITSPVSTTTLCMMVDTGIRTFFMVENNIKQYVPEQCASLCFKSTWFIDSDRIMFLNVKYFYSTFSKCVSITEIVIMVSWNTIHK